MAKDAALRPARLRPRQRGTFTGIQEPAVGYVCVEITLQCSLWITEEAETKSFASTTWKKTTDVSNGLL